MNRRALILVALVAATPLAAVLLAAALLLSAMVGGDFVWRQTDTDLASAIENDSPVAVKVFAAALPSVDTPIPYSHPRILNSRQMHLPPLAIALVHGHQYIVELLLNAGSDPATALGQLSLETASALLAHVIERQKPLSVTYLVKYRVGQQNALTVQLNGGYSELTPLELAIYYGDRWTMEALMEMADTRALGRGLMYAIRIKRHRALNLVLAHDARQRAAAENTSGGVSHAALSHDALTSAAGLAARIGNPDALAALANHGADLDSGSPYPPICGAIEADEIESLRAILEKGGHANPSTRCADGLSPVSFATRLGRTRAVSVLQTAGGQ